MFDQRLAPLLAAVPTLARPYVAGLLARLDPAQMERIALHMPICLAAAKHPDPEYGRAAFDLALGAMGLGLLAPQLWPAAVRYVADR